MQLPDLKKPLVMMLLCTATSGWAADYLYTPKPSGGEPVADGVLVREVTVKRGDTLSHISRQYSGRGHYYPQILLFNEIKNPHRIRPGQVVRVPLSHKAAQAQGAAKDTQQHVASAPQPAPDAPKKPAADKQETVAHAASKGERHAYQRAAAAFKKGDCDNAVKLYDAFTKQYPSSALLPEVSLNRAECYLKMSGS